MIHPLIAHAIDIFLGPKRDGVSYLLGTLIDKRALLPIKRHAVGVTLDKILVNFPDSLSSPGYNSEKLECTQGTENS